jgi:NarL family two-component system response regulator LiaR
MARPRRGTRAATLRVAIAHEHRLLLNALETVLEPAEDVELVGTTHEAGRVVGLLAELRPDVLLLGNQLAVPGQGPLLGRVRAAHPRVDVVLLAHTVTPELAHEALVGHGVKGVIDEGADEAAFAPTLWAAVRGEEPVVTAPVENLAEGLGLTPREETVLLALARGKTNAQIARELAIGTQTVKFHITNAYGKLGVTSRVEAVRLLIEKAIYPFEWL